MNELERAILAFFTDHYDYGIISDELAKQIAHDLAGVLGVRVLTPMPQPVGKPPHADPGPLSKGQGV